MKIITTIVLSLLILSFTGCEKQEPIEQTKLQLSTSLYPIYEIVKNVAGEKADVTKILPNGVGAHDYKPTPKDVVKLTKSDAVFYLGDEFEPWMGNLIKNHQNKIVLSKNIHLLKKEEKELDEDEDDGHHHHEHEHEHANMRYDPHFWLDIPSYMQMTRDVTEALTQLDPQNKDYYFLNAAMFINSLTQLNKEYKEQLSECKKESIIVTHNAYNYIAKEYGIEIIAIGSVVDEDEPTAKKISKIITLAKEKKIDTILLDVLSSNNFSTMVADELKAKKLYLHPLGNISEVDAVNEKNYLSIMRSNLKQLTIALQCQ